MVGIIILIAVVLIFLVGIAWIIYNIISGPKLPKGVRVDFTQGGKTAIVIVDKGKGIPVSHKNGVTNVFVDGENISLNEIAKKCAIAMLAVETSMQKKGIKNATMNKVVFEFRTDEQFETSDSKSWSTQAKKFAAYSTEYVTIFRIKKVDVAMIRIRYLETIIRKGQPALHELVHILNRAATKNYGSDHSDPNLWLGAGGSNSVEGQSLVQWLDLVEAFDE